MATNKTVQEMDDEEDADWERLARPVPAPVSCVGVQTDENWWTCQTHHMRMDPKIGVCDGRFDAWAPR